MKENKILIIMISGLVILMLGIAAIKHITPAQCTPSEEMNSIQTKLSGFIQSSEMYYGDSSQSIQNCIDKR